MDAVKTASPAVAGDRGSPPHVRLGYGAVLVFAGYYAAAKLGLALTPVEGAVPVLAPSGAILMAALLLAPVRAWPALLLIALPADLLADSHEGAHSLFALSAFVVNASQALIGAYCVRSLTAKSFALERTRDAGAFLACAVFLAPFLSAFLEAAFGHVNGLGGDYGQLWKARFFATVPAVLIFVPLIVTFAKPGLATELRRITPRRLLEAMALACGVLASCILAFQFERPHTGTGASLLYLPLPFLLWAVLRFGAAGAAASFATVAFLVIWGALHGRGPFVVPGGHESPVEIQLFLAGAGALVCILAALMQERRAAEAALRLCAERFATAFHASPDAMAINDASDGRFIDVNERWQDVFGHDREDVIGRTPHELDLVAEGTVREKLSALSGDRSGVHELTLAMKTARGEVLQGLIATRVVEMEGERRFVTIVRDDTERQRAQAALRESEARFRSLADTVPVMIWMAGPDKGGTFFSKGWLDFSGRPLEDELGSGWTKSVHPDDLERCLKVYGEAFDARRKFDVEYRRRRSDGSYRWVAGVGVPRVAADGTFLGYIGSCMDVTERRESEQMLKLALEVIPIGILVVDELGTIALANAHAAKLFGYARNELVGGCVDMLVGHGAAASYVARRDGIFSLPLAQAHGGDRHARRKDGSEFLAEVGLNPMETREGLLVLMAVADVSEHYELQRSREELAHMTRISIMGELAASLAHELNQPLAAILANAQAAQRFMAADPTDLQEVRAILEDIVKDDSRASEVIRRMRALARKGQAEIVPIDLAGVISDVAALLNRDAILRGVRLTLDAPAVIPMSGDRIQLQQVMLNLLLNAFDAVKDCPRGARDVSVHARQEHGRVEVAVSDRGTGLSRDKLDKIFTPFFTSKSDGLGLGLSICRSIIEAHGGRLRAVNNAGGGATFRFTLPVRESAVAVRAREGA